MLLLWLRVYVRARTCVPQSMVLVTAYMCSLNIMIAVKWLLLLERVGRRGRYSRPDSFALQLESIM